VLCVLELILTTQKAESKGLVRVITIMQKFYVEGEDGLLDMLL
jgi:hypothetical protein